MEYDVPDPAGDPITIFYAARAVMVQVISLEMSEVAISKLSEVQEIVQPLFSNIALHNACKQSREGVHGKQETEWRGYEKEGQDIFELTANMPAVKRSLMVFPVKRVEPLVKKSANDALARRKAAVEDIAMKSVFDQSPHWNSRQVENHSDPWMRAAQT